MVPIVFQEEGGNQKQARGNVESCPPQSNLPKGFIPIKINMLRSPGDYQQCIQCEERITISTSIMTQKQMTRINDQMESDHSCNIPVQNIEKIGKFRIRHKKRRTPRVESSIQTNNSIDEGTCKSEKVRDHPKEMSGHSLMNIFFFR